MDGEVSRLVDCMVNTLRSYVPAVVLGALAQTRERREYAEEVVSGPVKIKRVAIRRWKDRMRIE